MTHCSENSCSIRLTTGIKVQVTSTEAVSLSILMIGVGVKYPTRTSLLKQQFIEKCTFASEGDRKRHAVLSGFTVEAVYF